MSQEPAQSGAEPGLPDFSGGEAGHRSGLDDGTGPATLGAPSEGSLRRSRTIMLSVIGGTVVVLGVLALVLSQTVFRSVLEDPPASAYRTGERTAGGHSEYVPDPEDPDIAPPPPIFTQAPTMDCSIPPSSAPPPPSSPDAIRGGGLEFTPPKTWDFGWSASGLPYMTEIDAEARNVEGSWYSVVNVGRVVFPEDEGGFPGLESAAVAIFQCYATTTGVRSYFGENPVVTDYRSEVLTVDGHAAWIVQATYNFEDPDMLETSSASIVTSIVVDTPDGPSALASDVAADKPPHPEELEAIIASLEVVG